MRAHPLTWLFYVVQFDRDLSKGIERIVSKLIPSGQMNETSEELAAKIDAALESGSFVHLDTFGRNLSETEIRSFLVSLRRRLDETSTETAK